MHTDRPNRVSLYAMRTALDWLCHREWLNGTSLAILGENLGLITQLAPCFPIFDDPMGNHGGAVDAGTIPTVRLESVTVDRDNP